MVRAADLQARGGETAVPAGAGPTRGELAVFCRPVVTAPAMVRRDGSVLADGWLPDFVRLGELERHLGDGVIEAIVRTALEPGLGTIGPEISSNGEAEDPGPCFRKR